MSSRPPDSAEPRGVRLQSDGIRCDEAVDGTAALELTKTRAYDLVLSDIDMPGMTGPELLRELRAKPERDTICDLVGERRDRVLRLVEAFHRNQVLGRVRQGRSSSDSIG